MKKPILAAISAVSVGLLAYFVASAQTVSSVSVVAPLTSFESSRILDRFASGNVIYGPGTHQNSTTSLQNILANHPFEPGTFGAVTVFNAGSNGVTIRQVVDGVAHHINPGQTYCFPMRLELGRQIGVQFDTAASDNKIYWVIRSYQIRPTDL